MLLILKNNSSDAFSYVSGTVTVPANNIATINSIYWEDLAKDAQFIKDVKLNNIYLSDGYNTYDTETSLIYFKELLARFLEGNINIVSSAPLETKVKGNSDNTLIGNVGDRLKVDASISNLPSGVNAFTSKLRYDDMNVSTGGIARGTSVTEAMGWTKLYSYTGNGVYTGMSLGLATANTGWYVRLVLDTTEELFSSVGILTTDVDNFYGLAVGTQNTITTGLNLGTNASFFYHSAPTYNPIKFSSKIEVYVSRKTSTGTKVFNAGLITLTKET